MLPGGLVPLGLRNADVQAELRRRTIAHRDELAAARLRLRRLQRRVANVRQQLAALEQELLQVWAEQQSLLEPADGAAVVAAPDPHKPAMEALQKQLQAARALRREIAARVYTLIRPFLIARSPSPLTNLSKEEPPNA